MTDLNNESLDYLIKGNQFYDLNKFEHATIFYTKALQRTPDEKTYHNWANIQYIKGNYQKAMKLYKQAIAIKPRYDMAYNGWGSCLSRLGKYDEAIEKFDKSVEIGDFLLASFNLSLALFWQKKEVQAQTFFEKKFKETAMDELMLIKIYKFELVLIEERLLKEVTKEEKEFLTGRVAGYNWILEMISKAFQKERDVRDGKIDFDWNVADIDGEEDIWR